MFLLTFIVKICVHPWAIYRIVTSSDEKEANMPGLVMTHTTLQPKAQTTWIHEREGLRKGPLLVSRRRTKEHILDADPYGNIATNGKKEKGIGQQIIKYWFPSKFARGECEASIHVQDGMLD